jgi:hypothetical protein
MWKQAASGSNLAVAYFFAKRICLYHYQLREHAALSFLKSDRRGDFEVAEA